MFANALTGLSPVPCTTSVSSSDIFIFLSSHFSGNHIRSVSLCSDKDELACGWKSNPYTWGVGETGKRLRLKPVCRKAYRFNPDTPHHLGRFTVLFLLDGWLYIKIYTLCVYVSLKRSFPLKYEIYKDTRNRKLDNRIQRIYKRISYILFWRWILQRRNYISI